MIQALDILHQVTTLRVKHLAGQHNQKSHGRVGSSGVLELTDIERAALHDYSWVGGSTLNIKLRNEEKLHSGGAFGNPVGEKETVEAIDSSIRKSVVRKPITVYRKFDASVYKDKLSVGSIIEDKGFVSTTHVTDDELKKTRDIVGGYSDEIYRYEDAHMVVHLPVGSHALNLSAVSNYPQEREVLLPRNSKFKIMKVERDLWGNPYITVELQK